MASIVTSYLTSQRKPTPRTVVRKDKQGYSYYPLSSSAAAASQLSGSIKEQGREEPEGADCNLSPGLEKPEH